MRRPATAAAIGLIGGVLALSPAATAFAGSMQGATTSSSSATTTTTATPPTTTTTAQTTSTTAPASSTVTRPTNTPAARQHASQDAVVTVSTNCTYFCFVPAKTTVAAGTTVTWVDKSSTRHNITRCDPANCDGVSGGTGVDAAFTSAHIALPAGGTAHFTFAQPGTYVYYCAIHGYGLMHGTITVTAAAVTSTAPATVAPIAAAPTTTPAGPRLASTGAGSGGGLAAALILLVVGLAATSFHVRRRHA